MRWLLAGVLGYWPKEKREVFEERAAIQEYDGGLTREEAERSAFYIALEEEDERSDSTDSY